MKVSTDSQHYSNISQAIRSKSGALQEYYPSEMADAIKKIPVIPDDIPEYRKISNMMNHNSVSQIADLQGVSSAAPPDTNYETTFKNYSSPYDYFSRNHKLKQAFIKQKTQMVTVFVTPFLNTEYNTVNVECSGNGLTDGGFSPHFYVGGVKWSNLKRGGYSYTKYGTRVLDDLKAPVNTLGSDKTFELDFDNGENLIPYVAGSYYKLPRGVITVPIPKGNPEYYCVAVSNVHSMIYVYSVWLE